MIHVNFKTLPPKTPEHTLHLAGRDHRARVGDMWAWGAGEGFKNA